MSFSKSPSNTGEDVISRKAREEVLQSPEKKEKFSPTHYFVGCEEDSPDLSGKLFSPMLFSFSVCPVFHY